MTPTDRWGALVEFWDRCLQRAETDQDREYFQWEASQAWMMLEFYERNPAAGFDLVDGKIINRRVG